MARLRASCESRGIRYHTLLSDNSWSLQTTPTHRLNRSINRGVLTRRVTCRLPERVLRGSSKLTYGAEPFLRSCQLCSHSRTSQHFKEPEGSSPCSQESSISPYPEPDQSGPYQSILSKIHFNIIHPPTSWCSQ
jgi:hypothetical protein